MTRAIAHKVCCYMWCFLCVPCIIDRDCESDIVEVDDGYSDVKLSRGNWNYLNDPKD